MHQHWPKVLQMRGKGDRPCGQALADAQGEDMMSLEIRTPAYTVSLRTRVCGPSDPSRFAARTPANEQAAHDAACLLRQALSRLDAADRPIAAAYVDQALSMLGAERIPFIEQIR